VDSVSWVRRPRERNDLGAETRPGQRKGVYLLMTETEIGCRFHPVYAGNSKNVRGRIHTLNPEGWLQRVPVKGFFAYTHLGDPKLQAAEDAVKETFELE